MTLNKQNLSNGVKQESFSLYLTRLIFSVVITVSFGLTIVVVGYLLTKPKPAIQPPVKIGVSKIEISSDKKSPPEADHPRAEILNADTKEVILAIEDTKKYLKDSGYEYNPETFQTTNAKYEGDCFGEAALSNKKDKIVFSTSCLPGDLPQSWIGVYNLSGILLCIDAENKGGICPNSQRIKFLAGGSGRNFVWSDDDKTITYEADIGLSGMTEIKTIDADTGEILEKKSETEIDTSYWKTYRNSDFNFEIKYPKEWRELSNPKIYDNNSFLILKDDTGKTDINVRKFELQKGQSVDDIIVDNTIYAEKPDIYNFYPPREFGEGVFYCLSYIKAYYGRSCWIKEPVILQFELSANDVGVPFEIFDKILSTFKFIR